MRGGRNKFGPMYKRDRARKLQLMRQRQIAVQTLRGSLSSSGAGPGGEAGAAGMNLGYGGQQSAGGPFASIHIKQEIQIPQVSSLTSSPDSSPSPIAVALGQVGAASLVGAAQNSPGTAVSAAGTQQPSALQLVQGNPGNQGQMVATQDGKLWGAANSTTTSPHSLSPKAFQFDTVLPGASGGVPGNVSNTVKVSPLIRDFVQAVDDREWQNSLYSLLQSQTYNQCEVDLFELMCKVLDQNLFSQVDWARNSIFFKDLKVNKYSTLYSLNQ